VLVDADEAFFNLVVIMDDHLYSNENVLDFFLSVTERLPGKLVDSSHYRDRA
jgi:hypothetical protein